MDITQDFADAKYIITGYESESVKINNESYANSVIIGPEVLISPWQVNHCDDLNETTLSEFIQNKPEIAIIGTGEKLVLPDPKIIALFAQLQIGLETMSNSAACRTYGILVAEGRKAMAGIIFPKT